MTGVYCTISDVFKRYPLVSNVVGGGAQQVASADVTSIYIQDACSIVDAYLSRRYLVPLTPEPLLTWIASDLAIYRLFEDKAPRFPDAIEKRFIRAMSLVAGIQLGKMDLNSSQTVSNTGDQFAWSSAQSFAGSVFQPAESLTNCQSVTDPIGWLDRDDGASDSPNFPNINSP